MPKPQPLNHIKLNTLNTMQPANNKIAKNINQKPIPITFASYFLAQLYPHR